MRRLALQVPQIRRLYDQDVRLVQESHELRSALSAAEGERDALELQLYVMRSDHQRATVRNRELSSALRAAEDKAQTAGATSNELSILYAKLAGRLTLLSSEITRMQPRPTAGGGGTMLYLDLLERALAGMLIQDESISSWNKDHDPEASMIKLARLRNLRVLAERMLLEDISGDMLEAGVWRDGACVLMRGVLAAHGVSDRTVWVADSFAGLPVPNPETRPADVSDQRATVEELCMSSEEMQANFERYGLLDSQVRFLKGWFSEALLEAPVDQLALLRLNGDIYTSAAQKLDALYDKVIPGGYVIVDDYLLSGCRQAVDDFRNRHGIHDELNDVNGATVFWRKS